MFFHFKVLLYALLFALGLELFVFAEGYGIILASAILLIAVWGSRKIGKRWLFAITPFFFVFSSASLLYLIDSLAEKHIFIFFSTALYYLVLLGIYRLNAYAKDQTARGMVAASGTAALFFFYTSVYGAYLNFPIPLWILMLLFFSATVPISYQYFSLIKKHRRAVFLYSMILGLSMAEIAWVVNFWPFGYLTTGVIALIFYYILWDLVQSHFLNLLSKRRVVANVIFFIFLAALVLTSSRWLPIV